MKTKIFISFVIFQLVIIFVLGFKIYQRQKNILGAISFNPINKETIAIKPSDELKYFYEPKANSIEEIHKDWLPNVPKYTINSDALNERFDYDIKKKEGVFRIITIGDSNTFGLNVSTENNWTEVLEDRLNKEKMCQKVKKYEVINLGVGGYDTAYEVERYKIRGQKYHPDLVIWYVTDLYRITEKFQELAEKMNINEDANEKKGIFFEAWTKAREKIVEQYGEKGLVNYQMAKFKEFIKKYYINKPLLFISPWKQIEQNIRSSNIYFGDTKVWQDKKNFLPDIHFNDKGHKKFAQDVLDALDRNKLLPCD
jgi:lysophospholipase L1-like esterase